MAAGEQLYRLGGPVILGAIACTAGLLAQVLVWNTELGDVVPAAVLCGPLFVAAASLVNYVARRMAHHGQWAAWLAAAIAAGGLSASWWMLLRGRLDFYLFALTPDFHRLVDELEPDAFAVPLLFAAVAALLARWPARRRTPRGLLVIVAWASVFAIGALTALGAVRASRLPEPDHYLTTLPEPWLVFHAKSASLRAQPNVGPDLGVGAVEMEDDRIGPIVVRRFIFANHFCALWIRAEGEPLPTTATLGESHSFDCNDVTIFRDARHGLLIARPGGKTEPITVFREATGERLAETTVNTAMFVDGMAVPRTYLAGAALGVLVAIAALLWPSQAARRLRRRADWREGVLGDDGFIAFDDGTPPLHTPLANGRPRGSVVVIGAVQEVGGAAYRDGTTRGDVALVPGSLEALEAEARGSVEARPAFAFATVLLCGAPLIAAALCGLVVP